MQHNITLLGLLFFWTQVRHSFFVGLHIHVLTFFLSHCIVEYPIPSYGTQGEFLYYVWRTLWFFSLKLFYLLNTEHKIEVKKLVSVENQFVNLSKLLHKK